MVSRVLRLACAFILLALTTANVVPVAAWTSQVISVPKTAAHYPPQLVKNTSVQSSSPFAADGFVEIAAARTNYDRVYVGVIDGRPITRFRHYFASSVANTRYFGGETYVQSTAPDLPSYKQRNRFIGKSTFVGNKGINRIYAPVDLSFLPTGVTADQLESVEVVFTQYISEHKPDGFATSVYPLASPWSDLTLTWNNQPKPVPAIANHVYVSPAIGPKQWDVTSWAKQALVGSVPNYGLMIRADDETQGGGIFWSSQCDTLCPATDRPYIQVQLASGSPIFGDGRNGDLTVPGGTTLPIDTTSTAVWASETTAIPASSTGFDVGDLVLFHQTQGTATVGRWEFSRITAISSANAWTLDVPLTYAYDSTVGKAQAIKVPQYRNVQVPAGSTLTAPEWNGSTGGLLVFLANGEVNITGQVSMTGKGFKGGFGNDTHPTFCTGPRYGQQGQSWSGTGGCSSSSNGGGGGSEGTGSVHWGSGGGGGYGTAGENGTGPLPGDGGDTYGIDDLSLLHLGSGGGGGAWGTNPYGGGRNTIEGSDTVGQAAGAIIIYGSTIANSIIAADGNAGGNSAVPNFGGYAGGGGSGGSVKLFGGTIASAIISAQGGPGGRGRLGNGGAGGNGRIKIEYCNAPMGSINATPPPNIQQVSCDHVADSGFNPQTDTYGFANRAGAPSFEQFVADYGLPATTHLVTDTRVLEVITSTTSLTLPISFAPAVLTATLALTPTAALTSTTQARYVPRPIAYLYKETVVKAIYDDQFTRAYAGALKGGLCAGMASTVADFQRSHYQGLDEPIPSAFGGTDTVRTIPDQQSIQEFIQRYHGRQVDSGILNWLAEQGRSNAVDLYDHLRARMSSPDWWNDPEIIGIVKGTDCTDIEIGHALLPYKIVPQAGNHAFVYVYDSNYPPTAADDVSNRYIDFDLTGKSWAYQMAPGIIWSGKTIYSIPLGFFRDQPVLPTASNTDVMMVNGVHGRAWGGDIRPSGGYKWTFGVHGRAWGGDTEPLTGCYVSDASPTFVQEISHTLRITPFTGLDAPSTFPDTLFFPARQDWRFVGQGATDGNIGDMLLFGPQSVAGFMTTASATTRDSADVDAAFHSLTLRTNDPSKPISAYQMHETEAFTRVYAASNTMLGASEALTLTVSTSLDRFEIVNHAGTAKTLDVGFAQVGGDGIGTIVYPQQPIGPNERRVYTPVDWQELSHSVVRVDIDVNADGTIDYTDWIAGDVFPAAVALQSVPDKSGRTFAIIDRQVAPGQYGWINLDYPLPPRTAPKNSMRGNERVLRKWLELGGNLSLKPRGGFVGVTGRHHDLAEEIGRRSRGAEAIYHAGDIMIVPLYDRIIEPNGSRPLYYRIAGYAVVRILPWRYQGTESQVIGQLIAKVVY